ncbi:restriction endonuclease subunit S [Parvimonas micra]|uniref:restriction endonuclease subunit S n=1 Tax=Parvimonas micra TaxID=33033 RepID=UPI002003459F|nr:restriction endonuclease subunit S [Parvimonas micra]MCK6130266.1 restriction endonuclease subunit S [Parvimonas micra]MCK6135912.1 restriction endonuclease subunit S [Parvimonas micra]MCK6137384.1 restriction endonuclease subunit S [Parvimonas micra]MCK6153911.1 restriction endonuclease subunit S [Parvimonas micra]
MKYTKSKLPDICTIKTGKHDANLANKEGKYRFYTCSNQYSMCDTYSFTGESVIVPGNGDIGLVFYYDGEFDAYQRTYVLSDIKILPKYLFYHMQLYWRNFNDRKKFGSTVKYVRMSNFTNYEISYPSIEEQQCIVAKIEELFSYLDNAVETLNATKTQLEVYRQAVYASIYDYNNVRPITDFFEVTGGLTKNSKRNTLPKKMPYLRVANVYFNMLDLSEIKEIGVNEQEIEKCLLKKNDLLFVEGNGSKSQIGRVAIWDGSIENCLHQNHLIKARPLGNMIPAYALFYLISGGGRKQINEVSKSTSGLYTLSTNKVRELMIPYCDYEKQQQGVDEIESRLSVCKSIEETVDTALQQATAMRQSILKQAFEGRLL